VGIEWANALRPRPWLGLDLDFAYSYGRFTDDDPAGDRIPGAVEGIASAGLAIIDLHHVFASVWLRYFGQRPLIEDNSVRSHSSTLLNAEVGYEVARGVRLTLSGFNLLNTQASDVDYYYASRLPGESAPVEDVHFHPAESRSVRLALAFSP
jgi:outer membrane receptor protein involved in Fe transport